MDGDYSDILADPSFPNVREDKTRRWTSWLFGAKSAYIVLTLLVLYIIGIQAWRTFLLWREKSYKLALRRRHGIPDNDHRPFNVAYAAVLLARQKKEAEARRSRVVEVLEDSTPPAQDLRHRHTAQQNTQNVGQISLPGRFESSDTLHPSVNTSGRSRSPLVMSFSRPTQDHYNSSPVVPIADLEVNNSPSKARPFRKYTNIPIDDRRKRGFDGDDSALDHAKKTKVDDREYIDVNEDAERLNKYNIPSRGWKRVLGDGHDEPPMHTRDKRQRKISNERAPEHIDGEMEVDEGDDEVGELRSSIRGKKRGRKEAESVLGDDDDSEHEAEMGDDTQARRRHRKRRTYARKKSDVGLPSHGRKRDRDVAGSESDDAVATKNKSKKRGKKHVSPEQDKESDTSMGGGSQLSSSRDKQKRKIGDEWESNGVKYKIGPNGQRLRQTLIRKARQKFIMPEDSQHPDRQANLEVYVETWLTEAEYREAKDQQNLAWQDSNKPSTEPQTPPRVLQNPPRTTGKDLLWKSTPVASPGSSRHATPSQSSSILVNPFQNPQPIKSGKRIASAPRVPGTANSYPASPISPLSSINGSPRHRTYSKWEKQDLEAKAMMMLREANRKKEEEKAQKLKEEKETAEKLRKAQEATAPPALPAVPTITVTKPEEVKVAETKPPSFSFPSALAVDAIKKDSSSASVSEPKVAEKTAATFNFSSQTQPSTQSTASATASQQPAKPSSSLFGFPAPSTSTPSPAPTFPGVASSNAAAPKPPVSQTTNLFSFGPTPAQPAEKKAETTASGSSSSLLSRLAPTNTTPPITEQPAQAPGGIYFGSSSGLNTTSQNITGPFGPSASNTTPQNSVAPAQTQPTFSFTKPAAPSSSNAPQSSTPSTPNQPGFSFPRPVIAVETTKPSPISTTPSAFQNISQNATQPASSSAAAAPKFSFGFGSKPANAMPTVAAPTTNPNPFAASPSSSSLSGALGPDMNKPAANTFGFKAPQSTTQTTTTGPTAAPTATTIPTFSFGKPSTPSAPSAFSAPSATGITAAPTSMAPAATPSSTTVAASPFSGLGTPSGQAASSSMFPNATQTTATANSAASPFGFSNTFGGVASSSSGNTAATSTSEPSKSFSFGNASGAGTAPKAAEPPKASPFAFNPPPAAPSTSTNTAFTFGATTTAPSSSTFGNAPKPSAYGFGAGLMTPPAPSVDNKNATNPFTFGANAPSTSTTTPSFGNVATNDSNAPQPFQPSAGQSAFGKTSAPSAFTFGSQAATSTNTGNNLFGSGAFGKAPAASGQQQQ